MQLHKNIFFSVSFFAVFLQVIIAGNANKLNKMDIESTTKESTDSKTNAKKLDYEGKNQVVFCVNRELILEKCKLALEMRKALQELDQKLYDEIKPMAMELEKMQQEFQKKAKTLSPEACAKEEEVMMRTAQEFQMKNMESQELLKREEYRIIREFSQELSASCKEFLSQNKNLNVVLIPIDNATFVHAKYDATEEILSIMDASFESKKKEASEKAAKKSKSDKK